MNRELFSTKKILALVAIALVGSFYLFFPLDWGLMDDSEYVLGIQNHLKLGWLQGTWNRISEHASIDLRTGIFRPSFWWYTALAYQLPVRIAYFSRFLEYFIIIACGLIMIRSAVKHYLQDSQNVLIATSVCSILAIRSLYEGIAFFSLQEFTGLFFVVLGFFVYSRENAKQLGAARFVLVLFLISIGIGFKPPFVWIYFLFALGLFFYERRRVWAIGVFGLGAIYFYITMRLAQTGFYSQEIYQFSATRFIQSILSFAKHISPVFVVLFAVVFLIFRPAFTRKFPRSLNRMQWIGIEIFGAGVLYMGTLLPRGIGDSYGYYFGPPIFLLTLGILIASTIFVQDFARRSKLPNLAGSVLVALVTLFIFVFSMKSFVERNLAVAEFKKWARENNQESIILATNSYEVAFRLRDIYLLNYGEYWRGQIKNLTHNSPYPAGVTHYLVFSDQVEPRRSAMGELVWEKGSAQLVRIRPETP